MSVRHVRIRIDMKNKAVVAIILVFMIFQVLMDGVFIYFVMEQNNRLDANLEVMGDFSDNMMILDRKIITTLNAHNAEVDSWFAGNAKIRKISQDFFLKMESINDEGMLANFTECIMNDSYNEYYTVLVPHLDNNLDVDGYEMHLYSLAEFEPIAGIRFSRENVIYSVNQCGVVYYNVTSEQIWYSDGGIETLYEVMG